MVEGEGISHCPQVLGRGTQVNPCAARVGTFGAWQGGHAEVIAIARRSARRGKSEPPPPQAGVEHSGFDSLTALWRIRPFRRLWLVLGLSSMGDWLGLLAAAIFASGQVTGSAAQGAAFGSVVGVRMLPALVFGPLARVVADRWDR